MTVLDQARAAYTHGLEAIYKVETIDLKSVRYMEKPVAPIENASSDPIFFEAEQLEFDFGPKFRNWVAPFLEKEPIQVLRCSRLIEKWLLEQHLNTIGALLYADLGSEPYSRKLGQGQRDEVQASLTAYLKGKDLKRCRYFDFLSLLKASCGTVERKKLHALLAPYGLEEWMQLSPMEIAEIRKMSDAERKKCAEEALAQVNRGYFEEAYEKICDAFILPWIEKRGGVATAEEVHDCLLLRAKDPLIAERVLRFQPIQMERFLPSDSHIYFSSKEEKEHFATVLRVVQSYFPNQGYRYAFSELRRYVLLELTNMGINADPRQIQKAWEELKI